MRTLWLVLGLVVGFALGYAVRESAPRRAERRGGALPVAPGVGVQPAPRAKSVRNEAPAPPPVAAEPAQPIPEDEVGDPAWGRVIVDFRGSELDPSATIAGRDVFGNPDDESQTADETGLIEFSVRAGRLLVSWRGRDGERLGAWVRVEGGRTTHLAVDKGTPLPLPAGLGRIAVFVTAIGGGPQPGAIVELEGDGDIWSESTSEVTTATGRCQFEVIPGTHKLTLGARVIEAVVEPGTTRAIEFRHEQEGDLLIRNAPPLTSFQLVRVNEDPDAEEESFGSEGLFLYLRQGRYQLFANVYANGNDNRELGTVRILAKQRVELDPQLPTGGLRFVIVSPDPVREVNPVVHLRATLETMAPSDLAAGAEQLVEEDGRTVLSAEFVALSPGTYAVEISGEQWKTVKRLVRVDRDVRQVDVELEPEPK